MSEQMTLRGTLRGHNGWVTQIATTSVYPDTLLSASRGTVFLTSYYPCDSRDSYSVKVLSLINALHFSYLFHFEIRLRVHSRT